MSPTVIDNNDDITETLLVESISSVSEMVNVLAARIDENNQFFLIIWHGATLQHQLMSWDRQWKKSPTP